MSAFPSNVSTVNPLHFFPFAPSAVAHLTAIREGFCDPVVVVARRSFAACRAEWAPCVRPAAETVAWDRAAAPFSL